MPIHNNFYHKPGTSEPNPDGILHVGAIMPIEIHVPPKIADVLNKEGKQIPQPVTGTALVDTGATMTCVHEPMLKRLCLNPVGAINSGTANGPVQQNLYPATLQFPVQGWGVELNAVAGVDLTGQRAPLDPPVDIIALIGRNLLKDWVLIWNGPGGYWSIAV